MSAALLSSLEQAFKSHLEATVTGITTFYTGQGNEDKEAPCVIISADDATEAIQDTGNYEVPVNVTAK